MTIYPTQLLQELRRSTIFLDTNVFGVAALSSDFLDLLTKLTNESECALTSIPSVLFEFTRGSNTVEVYNQNVDFFNLLVSHVDPMTFMANLSDFSIVMAKVNSSNKSYTDFLLAACLYNYRHLVNTYLMTADIRALPNFYDRTHLITTEEDKSKEIRNFAIYKFNTDNYAKAAATIITEAKAA